LNQTNPISIMELLVYIKTIQALGTFNCKCTASIQIPEPII